MKSASAVLIKRPPDTLCNSRKRGDGEPGYCTRPAGWGTDHASVGRCKLHGGGSPLYKKTELIRSATHSAASDAAPKSVRDRAMDYQTDPDLTDLTREIATLRAMEATIKLEMDKAGETRDFAGLKSYAMLANTIGKLVEKQEQVLHNRKYLVSIHTVIRWSDAIKGILQNRVKDPELLSEIATDIAKLSNQSDDFP